MDTLFNSAAYWGCFQGTLIFELNFDYKSKAQCSFLTHLFLKIVPSMLKVALKNFQSPICSFYLT